MVTGEDNGFTEAIAPVYLGVEPVNGKLLGRVCKLTIRI
jgi:hypothetical protein